MIAFLAAFTLGLSNVQADYTSGKPVTDTASQNIQDKSAIMVCQYAENNTDVQTRIYYYFTKIDDTTSNGTWQVRTRKSNDVLFFQGTDSMETLKNAGTDTTDWTTGSFSYVFGSGSKRISYDIFDSRMSDNAESTFTCPNYSFHGSGTACFSDAQSCGDKFKSGPYAIYTNSATTRNTDTIFFKIDDFLERYTFTDNDLALYVNNKDLDSTIRQSVRNYIKQEYSLGTVYKYPDFIENYISKVGISDAKYAELQQKAATYIDRQVAAGNMTREEGNAKKDEIQNKTKDSVFKNGLKPSENLNIRDGDDCKSVLGPDMTIVIQNVFTFIQYLGPILIAVLSIMDFVKAATSGDEGDMKKAGTRLAKRLVCGILLFFVPLICKRLLKLGGIILPDMCIK